MSNSCFSLFSLSCCNKDSLCCISAVILIFCWSSISCLFQQVDCGLIVLLLIHRLMNPQCLNGCRHHPCFEPLPEAPLGDRANSLAAPSALPSSSENSLSLIAFRSLVYLNFFDPYTKIQTFTNFQAIMSKND